MAQTIITPENLESIKAKLEENDYYWVHIEEKQKPIIHQFTLGALFMCGTGYCSRFESIYSIDIYPIIYSTPSDGLSAEELKKKMLDAIENNATVGEISDTLRRVFGEYQESVVI